MMMPRPGVMMRRAHMFVMLVVLATMMLMHMMAVRRVIDHRWPVIVVPDRRLVVVVMMAVSADDHTGNANPDVHIDIGPGGCAEQACRHDQPQH